MYKYKFTSVLRIPKVADFVWELIEKYKDNYDEVIYFTQKNHSVRCLDDHRKTADFLKPVLEKTREIGLPAGIDPLCTVGFFPQSLEKEMDSYKKHIGYDGGMNHGKLCMSDEKSIEYVKEQCRIYARTNPSIIYIDDDVNALECFCPVCIERFSREYGIDCGNSLEKLKEFFENDNMNIRKDSREKWISYTSKRICEVFDIIEKSIHEINPDIKIGMMTYKSAADGLDGENWAEALSKGKEIAWRPGGGAYTDFVPRDIVDKTNRIGAQIRYLPDYVTRIECEQENFPYQCLKKTENFTAFEILMYLAGGCTGATYNVISWESVAKDEYERFFAMAENIKKTGSLIVDTFQRSKPKGIGFWWDKNVATCLSSEKWTSEKASTVPFADEIQDIGIPLSYDNEHTDVFLMNKDNALQISDAELENILKKAVILDADALDVINERGYGEYTGFKTIQRFSVDIMERELDHPINDKGKAIHNLLQAFGWSKEATTIEKTSEKAEYLTEYIDFYERTVGFGAGIFENKFGGRVHVNGANTYTWYYSMARSNRIKRIIRWLSKDMLDCYIKSYHRLTLWARENGAFIANLSTEIITDGEIAMKAEKIKTYVIFDGRVINEVELTPYEKDGNYFIYKLPQIPILGEVLIKY